MACPKKWPKNSRTFAVAEDAGREALGLYHRILREGWPDKPVGQWIDNFTVDFGQTGTRQLTAVG